MKIRYSSHAVERMISRNVTTAEIEDLLRHPDGTIRQSRDKVIAFKKVKGRKDNMLAAVAVQQEEYFEVVTVMVNFEVGR